MNLDRDRTVQDVLDTFSEEQMKVLHFLIDKSVEDAISERRKHQERIFWITDGGMNMQCVSEYLENGWRVKNVTPPVRESVNLYSIVVLEKD